MQAVVASGTVASIAGCTGFEPPDPLAPATERWAMPLADGENTASNGLTRYAATGFDAAWSTHTDGDGGSAVSETPLVATTDSASFAAYPETGLVRHDSETGAMGWRVPSNDPENGIAGEITSSPVIAEGSNSVVVATDAGTIHGIDAGDGAVRWTIGEDELANEAGEPVEFGEIGSTVAATTDDVILATSGGDVLQIAAGSGRLRGVVVSSEGAPTGPPIVTGESVIGTYPGAIRSLSLDGLSDDPERESVWSGVYPVDREVTYADVPGIHHGGILIIPTESGRLVGIDVTPDNRYDGDLVQRALGFDDERTVWDLDVGTVTGHGTRSGNVVVFPRERDGESGLIAVATGTGSKIWGRTFDAGVTTSPVSSKGLVYVVDGARRLHVVDALTGHTVEAEDTGVTGSSLVLGRDALVGNPDEASDLDDPIRIDDEPGSGIAAYEGEQSRSTLEHLRENVMAVAGAMDEKTAKRVVPLPLEDEDADNVIDEVANVVLDAYDDGTVSYDVARGVFERLTWVLRGSDLLLTATRARRPERDQLFLFNSTPTDLVGYTSEETPNPNDFNDPDPFEPRSFEREIAGPDNSLAAHQVYGLIRTAWNVVMLVPLARIANVSRRVLRHRSVTRIASDLRAFGTNALKLLRDFRSFLATARSDLDRAVASLGGTSEVLRRIVESIVTDLPEEAFVELSDRGTRMLTGIGIIDVIEAVLERLAAEIADASTAQFLEQPIETDAEARGTEDRMGDPRTDSDGNVVEFVERVGGRDSTAAQYSRTATTDGWFDGYTAYEAIDAAVQMELVEGLTDQNELPANRQAAANAAEARYREMLRDITEFNDSRAFLDWGDLYPDGAADQLRDVFDVTENPELMRERVGVEIGIFATELLWNIIDDLTDIPGGLAQSMNGAIAISNQAQIAHGLGLEDVMYGVDPEGTV